MNAVRHLIFLTITSTGEKYAYKLSGESAQLTKNEFVERKVVHLIEEANNVSTHRLTTSNSSWDSIIELDRYFSDYELLDYEKFKEKTKE